MSKEAMKQALDFLRLGHFTYPTKIATDLEEALAKQEGQSNFCPQCEALARELKAVKQEQGEPVGEIVSWPDDLTRLGVKWIDSCPTEGAKIYTTTQQRTWIGLTDEEREQVYKIWRFHPSNETNLHLCKAIEAKLKEKNG